MWTGQIVVLNSISQILVTQRRRGVKTFAKVWVVFFLIITFSCSKDYQPKPKGYNRLVLPAMEYRLSPDSLPYQFEYSTSARLLRDSSWFSERNWVEIYYPALKANVHITYKKLDNREQFLKELLNDAYNLTAKQQIKASAIDEVIVVTPSGKTAVIAEIAGEVPSQFQFTMTDSSKNFLPFCTLNFLGGNDLGNRCIFC